MFHLKLSISFHQFRHLFKADYEKKFTKSHLVIAHPLLKFEIRFHSEALHEYK